MSKTRGVGIGAAEKYQLMLSGELRSPADISPRADARIKNPAGAGREIASNQPHSWNLCIAALHVGTQSYD